MPPYSPEKDAAWKTLGGKLHKRALKLYGIRHKDPAKLAMTLAEIRRLELYKDIGCETWSDYCEKMWSRRKSIVYHWALCGDVFSRFKEELKLLFPIIGLRRLALLGNICETKEELVWWARLARLTNFLEFRRILDGYRQALRCGLSGYASTFVCAGVLSEHYEEVVAPAHRQARAALGPQASAGQLLTWICAQAIGVSLPDTLGVDSDSMRRAGRPDRRLGAEADEESGPYAGEVQGERPRLEGGIADYIPPGLTTPGFDPMVDDGDELPEDSDTALCGKGNS